MLIGDVRTRLQDLPEQHFQAIVTSPPYWGLRDYNHPDQIGLEPDPRDYLRHIVEVFRGIRPSLRNDGTLWVNMGDCYVTGTTASHKSGRRGSSQTTQDAQNAVPRNGYPFELAPKNLVMMPARVALALQDDGWILRSVIIWEKPNPMPEAIYDRPTTSHEYLYQFSKRGRYFYDFEAAKDPYTEALNRYGGENKKVSDNLKGIGRVPSGWEIATGKAHHGREGRYDNSENPYEGAHRERAMRPDPSGKNRRTVWKIPTFSYKGAHFATYPPELVRRILQAAASPKACEKCGAAWRMVAIEKVPTGGRESGNLERKYRVDHGGNPELANAHQGFGFPWTPTSNVTERQPTCKCEAQGTGRSVILDPFGGAGTTGLVADRMGMGATLVELNRKYAKLAAKRLQDDSPLFAESLNWVVAYQENDEAMNADRELEEIPGDFPDFASPRNHSD